MRGLGTRYQRMPFRSRELERSYYAKNRRRILEQRHSRYWFDVSKTRRKQRAYYARTAENQAAYEREWRKIQGPRLKLVEYRRWLKNQEELRPDQFQFLERTNA